MLHKHRRRGSAVAGLAGAALHAVCDGPQWELTLFGGHTDGFVLSPSAWYLKGGAWHEVTMKYPHVFAFCTLLPDGRVMLGGGSVEAFGIGQSWGVEIYDPATHSFTAEGILDRKRAGASALALPDGKVLVSGNWYAPDAMEVYEPGCKRID